MEKTPLIGRGWVWAWVALCLGFGAGHFLSRVDRVQERAAIEKVRGELDALKVETTAAAAAQQQLAGLTAELAATKAALAAALARPSPGPAPSPAAETPPADAGKALAGMVIKVGQAQVKDQVEGRLGVLRERLSLTPEQAATVKKLLEEEAAAAAVSLERVTAGAGMPADFGRLARLERGELPPGVEAALTDDQKYGYAAFRDQERLGRVEILVAQELSGLAAGGGLTPEQKDQAFSALSEVLMAEDATNLDSMKDRDEVGAYVETAARRRLDIMRPILSRSQFELYQQQVDLKRQIFSKLAPPHSR